MYSIFEWAANGQREYSVRDYTRAQLMPRTHMKNNRRSGCWSCNLYKIENPQLFNDALLIPIHPWCRGEGEGSTVQLISWDSFIADFLKLHSRKYHTYTPETSGLYADWSGKNTLNEGSLRQKVQRRNVPIRRTTHEMTISYLGCFSKDRPNFLQCAKLYEFQLSVYGKL